MDYKPEIKNLINQAIKYEKYLKEVWGYFDLGEGDVVPSGGDMPDLYREQFGFYFEKIRYVLISLLETTGNKTLLNQFISWCSLIDKKEYDLFSTIFWGEDGVPNSQTLHILSNYMNCFYADDKEMFDNILLKRILNNSAQVLSLLDINVTKEQDCTNAIVKFLKIIYSDISHGSTRTRSKDYYPDITIPSINTAIEVKLSYDEASLVTCIEQLKIDQDGYDITAVESYPHFYNKFYCMCFHSHDEITQERFSALWTERNFNVNWIPFFIKIKYIKPKKQRN